MPSLFSMLLAFLTVALHCPSFTLASPAAIPQRQTSIIPDYVKTYAPLVWLDSHETYMPSDLGAQLVHTRPENNFVVVDGVPTPLTLDNLDVLNAHNGSNVYLTSLDDVTTNPTWLNGVRPDSTGKTIGATSTAVIVVDHGSGNVDAFYMYFYAYNWGGEFFGQLVDDHVGDWEHTMVRFQNGLPTSVWFSQHAFGEAFTYPALEKHSLRPIAYSANGSHANYATPGTHDHTIPGFNLPAGLLEDFTDRGTLWDPLLNAYFYTFDPVSNAFAAADDPLHTPSRWLDFVGRWGDEEYPDTDPRQHKIAGIPVSARFTSGPTGPRDKQLVRREVCPTSSTAFCIVRDDLGP